MRIKENANNMNQKCLFIYVGQKDYGFCLANERDYEMKREPQIGFAYLSAVLRQNGIESEILDFTITPQTKESLIDYIIKESPLFVGFYAAEALKNHLLEYLNDLRKRFPNLKILIGGPDIYDSKSYLDAGANAYCIGEGEKTIIELVAYCKEKLDLSQIKGITYKEKNKIKHTPPRDLIENLDELPIPAWDKYDLNKYHDYHIFDMRHPYTSIMASRGCPFKCTYCVSHRIWGNRYRCRSPEHVMKEIDYLVIKQGVRYITFQDDIWSWMDDDWAKTICQELINRKYDLKWRSILHPFSFLKSRQKILPIMKEAGCTAISTGLQSASGKILKNINRSPKEPEAMAELIGISEKLGMLNSIEFIFGLPGDTEETIEKSILYSLKVKPTFAAFYALSILPGSDIWRMEKEGKFQSLPGDFIKRKCKEASRRFYTNPKVIYNILKTIIKTNPKWFLTSLAHLKYLLETSGISKAKTR